MYQGTVFRPICSQYLTLEIQACLSAKRKQCFADIQTHSKVKPVRQLLIDMPVRWSSIYIMTLRGEEMCDI